MKVKAIRSQKLPVIHKKFLDEVRFQLRLQSREPNVGPGGHPDPVIRRFYRAVNSLIAKKEFRSYRDLVVDVHLRRPGMNSTHFVNLWFRSLQSVLRSRGEKSYLGYSLAGWKKYLKSVGREDIAPVRRLLLTRNTATHVPARYRSFNAALRLIAAAHPEVDLRIGDIGCSLGFGLKACLANGYLHLPPFTDDTPGQQVSGCFNQVITHCSRAVGIDISIPNLDWVKACNYPSRYDADGAVLDKAAARLDRIPFKVIVRRADILNPRTVKVLTNGKPLNAVYSSMALHELPRKDQYLAYRHIAAALCEGGVFIEFTFVNPNNWFRGIHTIVRVNHRGRLSRALVWHRWADSRCSAVKPGRDFHRVNQILSSIGAKL